MMRIDLVGQFCAGNVCASARLSVMTAAKITAAHISLRIFPPSWLLLPSRFVGEREDRCACSLSQSAQARRKRRPGITSTTLQQVPVNCNRHGYTSLCHRPAWLGDRVNPGNAWGPAFADDDTMFDSL